MTTAPGRLIPPREKILVANRLDAIKHTVKPTDTSKNAGERFFFIFLVFILVNKHSFKG